MAFHAREYIHLPIWLVVGVLYIASNSYGKDSLKMIDVIVEDLELPLDEIITVDVMFNDFISAYYPEVEEFRLKADEIIKRRYGLEVKHLRSEWTYESRFYKARGDRAKEENRGKIYGFPIVRGAWCNSDLKMSAIEKYKSEHKDSFWYIGYAIDEKKSERQEKIKNCKDLNMYPLVKAGLSERDCYEWCKKNGLLNPTYENFSRDGCWFCHYQTLDQLRFLRKNYPDKWQIMLRLDRDSPKTFKTKGVTLHDLDIRFSEEEKQIKISDYLNQQPL